MIGAGGRERWAFLLSTNYEKEAVKVSEEWSGAWCGHLIVRDQWSIRGKI